MTAFEIAPDPLAATAAEIAFLIDLVRRFAIRRDRTRQPA
jgi:hypothetical protein